MRIRDLSADVCSSDLRDLVLRIDHAGRDGRVVEQEDLGLFRQRGIELRGGELVVLRRRARQQLDVGVEDLADADVAGPVRGGEGDTDPFVERSEEQMSDLQVLMRNSYAVFCLTNKKHGY